MDLRAFYFQAAEAAAAAATVGDAAPSEAALLKTMEVQQGQGGGASPVGVNGDGDSGACEGGSGVRDLICPECGKAFLSDKAMYGHLRSHPERRYKGAIRPPTPVVASASDAKARKVPWLQIDLPTRWPLTAKRGRTPTVSTSTPVCAEPVSVLESSCCGAEEEAAKTLLDLAQHARIADQLALPADHLAVAVVPGPEQPVIPAMVAGGDALQHVQQEVEKTVPVEHIFGIILAPQSSPGQSNFMSVSPSEPANNSAALVMVRDEDKIVSPGAKKPKKRRLHDPAVSQAPDSSQPANPDELRPPVIRRIPSPASDRRYTCPTCFKSFPTHQALGGHMANHNRAIRQHADGLAVAQAVHNIWAHRQRHDGANAAANGLGEDLQISLMPPPPPPPPASHTCSRCRQIFATGQALGGHMRKHFIADRLRAGAAAPATAPPALAAAAAAPAVPAAQDGGPRDFDLNEMLAWE